MICSVKRSLIYKSLLLWLSFNCATLQSYPPTNLSAHQNFNQPSRPSSSNNRSVSDIKNHMKTNRRQSRPSIIQDNTSDLSWLPMLFNITDDEPLKNILEKMDGSEYSLSYLLPLQCLLSITVAEYAFAPEISFFVTCGDGALQLGKKSRHQELTSCIYSGAHLDQSRKLILKYLRGQSEDERCPRGRILIELHERIARRLGAHTSVLDDESFYILKPLPTSINSAVSPMAAKHVPGTRSSGTVSQADGGVDRIRSIVYETLFSDRKNISEPQNYYTKYGQVIIIFTHQSSYHYMFQSCVQRNMYYWAVEYVQQVSMESTLQQVFQSNPFEMQKLTDIFNVYRQLDTHSRPTAELNITFDTLSQLLQYLCRFDVVRLQPTFIIESLSIPSSTKKQQMEHCRYILRQVFIRYRVNVFKAEQDIGLWDALDILNAIVPMHKNLK